MKQILLLISSVLLFCTSNVSMAQDIILKKDKSEIQAKVTDVLDKEIKYKKWNNQTEPAYILKIADIISITYENGSVDEFGISPAPKQTTQAKTEAKTEAVKPIAAAGSIIGKNLDDAISKVRNIFSNANVSLLRVDKAKNYEITSHGTLSKNVMSNIHSLNFANNRNVTLETNENGIVISAIIDGINTDDEALFNAVKKLWDGATLISKNGYNSMLTNTNAVISISQTRVYQSDQYISQYYIIIDTKSTPSKTGYSSDFKAINRLQDFKTTSGILNQFLLKNGIKLIGEGTFGVSPESLGVFYTKTSYFTDGVTIYYELDAKKRVKSFSISSIDPVAFSKVKRIFDVELLKKAAVNNGNKYELDNLKAKFYDQFIYFNLKFGTNETQERLMAGSSLTIEQLLRFLQENRETTWEDFYETLTNNYLTNMDVDWATEKLIPSTDSKRRAVILFNNENDKLVRVQLANNLEGTNDPASIIILTTDNSYLSNIQSELRKSDYSEYYHCDPPIQSPIANTNHTKFYGILRIESREKLNEMANNKQQAEAHIQMENDRRIAEQKAKEQAKKTERERKAQEFLDAAKRLAEQLEQMKRR